MVNKTAETGENSVLTTHPAILVADRQNRYYKNWGTEAGTHAADWALYKAAIKNAVDEAKTAELSADGNAHPMRSILKDFPKFHVLDDKLILSNGTSSLVISSDGVAMIPMTRNGAVQPMSAKHATGMAFLAALNPAMAEGGAQLKGSDANSSLLRAALNTVNAGRVADKQISLAVASESPVPKISSASVPAPQTKRGVFAFIANAVKAFTSALEFTIKKPPVPDVPGLAGRDVPSRRAALQAMFGGAVAAATVLKPDIAQAGLLEDLFGVPAASPVAEPSRGLMRYQQVRAHSPKRRPGESNLKFSKRKKRHQRALKKSEARLQQEQQSQPRQPTAREIRREQLQTRQAERHFARQDVSQQPQYNSYGSGEVFFRDTHSRGSMVVRTNDIASCRAEFNEFARDWRTKQTTNMDPQLLHYIAGVSVELKRMGYSADTVELVSGYRSRETNDSLRKTGGKQAKDSQHCYGRALDIRVQGVPTHVLFAAANRVVGGNGGVGLYVGDRFVHMDSRGHHARWGAPKSSFASLRIK